MSFENPTMTEAEVLEHGFQTYQDFLDYLQEVAANPAKTRADFTVSSFRSKILSTGQVEATTLLVHFDGAPVLYCPDGHEVDIRWEYTETGRELADGSPAASEITQAEYTILNGGKGGLPPTMPYRVLPVAA